MLFIWGHLLFFQEIAVSLSNLLSALKTCQTLQTATEMTKLFEFNTLVTDHSILAIGHGIPCADNRHSGADDRPSEP